MSKIVPTIFPTIGGWDYQKVWKEKQTFCKFVMKVQKPTGFMKDFKEFCEKKNKEDNVLYQPKCSSSPK